MRVLRTNFDRTEMRRDRRYPIPVFDIMIGGTRFRSINWSLGGLLLDGACEGAAGGARVRGVLTLTGTGEAFSFGAAVVRSDAEAGRCALHFQDIGSAGIDFLDRAVAHRLH